MSCELRTIMTQVIAQLCGHVGFEQITESSLELLLDVFEQYFVALAKNICSLGTFDGSAELEDGLFAIRMLGQTPQDLLKFLNETGPYFSKPPPTICGPINGKVCLNIPPENHEELRKRPTYIPAHLPLNYCWEDNGDDTTSQSISCGTIATTTTTTTTTTTLATTTATALTGASTTGSSGTAASRSLPAWACRTSYRMACVSVDPLTKCLIERCPPGRIVDTYPDSPTYGTNSVASVASSSATVTNNTNNITNLFPMQSKREPLHSPASLRSGASSPQISASTSLQGASDAQWAAALQATPTPQPLKRIVYTPSRFDPSDAPSSSHLKRSTSSLSRVSLFGKHTVPSRATESTNKRQTTNTHLIPSAKTTRLNVVARTRRRSRVGRPRGGRFARSGRTPKSPVQQTEDSTVPSRSSSDLLERTPPAVDNSLDYTVVRSDDDGNDNDRENRSSLEFVKEMDSHTPLQRTHSSDSDRTPVDSLSSISNLSKDPSDGNNDDDDDDDDKSLPAKQSSELVSNNEKHWTSKPSTPCPSSSLSPTPTKPTTSPEVQSHLSLASPERTPPAVESDQTDLVHEPSKKSEPSNMVTVSEPISTILQSTIRPKLKSFGRGRPRGRKRSTSSRLAGINSLFQNPLRLKGSQIVPPTTSDSTNQINKTTGPITNLATSESSTKSVTSLSTTRSATSQRVTPFGNRQRRYSSSSFTRRKYSNSENSAHKIIRTPSKSGKQSRDYLTSQKSPEVFSSPNSDSTEPMVDEARAELLVIPIKTEAPSIFVETSQSDSWKNTSQSNSTVREFNTNLAFRKDSFGKLQPTAAARAQSLTSSPSSLDSSLSSSSSLSSPGSPSIKPDVTKYEPKHEYGLQLSAKREASPGSRLTSKVHPTPPSISIPVNSISDSNSSVPSTISSLSSSASVPVTKPETTAAITTPTELLPKPSKSGESPSTDKCQTSLGPPPLLLLSGKHEDLKPVDLVTKPTADTKEPITLPPPVLLPVRDVSREHPKVSSSTIITTATTSAFTTITTTANEIATQPLSSLSSTPSIPSNGGGLRIKIRLGAGPKIEEPLASSLSPSSSSSTSLSSSGSTPDTPALCGQASLGVVHTHPESVTETPSDNKIVIRLGAKQPDIIKSENSSSTKDKKRLGTSDHTVITATAVATTTAHPLQLTISRDRFTYRGQTTAADSNSSNSSSSSSISDSPLSSADEDSSTYEKSAQIGSDLTDSLPPPPCLERLPSRQVSVHKSSHISAGSKSGSIQAQPPPPPPLTAVSSHPPPTSSGPTSLPPTMLSASTADLTNVHCELPPLLPLFSTSSESVQESFAEPAKPELHGTYVKESRKRKRRRSSHIKRGPPPKRKITTEISPSSSFDDSKPSDHRRGLLEQSRSRVRVDSVFTDDENENDRKEKQVTRTSSFPTSTQLLPPPPPLEKLPISTTKLKITTKPNLFSSPTQPAPSLSRLTSDFSPTQTSWTVPNPVTSNSLAIGSKISTAFPSSPYSSSAIVESSGKTQPRTKQTSVTPTKVSHSMPNLTQIKPATNFSPGLAISTVTTTPNVNTSIASSGISGSVGRKDRSRTRIPSELPFCSSAPVQREPASQIVVASAGSSYYFNNNGEQIWLCPICLLEDDGNLMIGCDSCDDWYHSTCLGLSKEPEVPQWFCPKCSGQPLPSHVTSTQPTQGRPIMTNLSSNAISTPSRVRTPGSFRKQTPGAHVKTTKRRGKK